MTSQLGTDCECDILLFTFDCKTSEMEGDSGGITPIDFFLRYGMCHFLRYFLAEK